jgi:RimJ/RimL family protein N-acetyltransferase
MSLLLGDGMGDEFRDRLIEYILNISRARQTDEWMQVFSDNWQNFLTAKLNDRLVPAETNTGLNYSDNIELNTRVNFKFNVSRYRREQYHRFCENVEIRQLDKITTKSMYGNVIPLNFWNSEDEFLEKGIGFSVFVTGEQVATAYSAFVHDKYLEIGIETVKKYRGMGYAKMICSSLIDYCIRNGFEPIWSCRLENTGSYNLAIRLGFEPTLRLPYYRLCKTS